MRAHYFQHVPFEGLGSIEPWLQSAGYEITQTRYFESAEQPDPEMIDLLVIMGGPMSINDEAEFPWLVAEKQFIREAIQLGTPILGICLGAQLIASAMGARVYGNPVKEIGWWPIHGIQIPPNPPWLKGGTEQSPALFNFPPSLDAFHWHGETFDLPAGAIHLASSAGCVHQAFQLGASVIGLQFHLETTPQLAQNLVTHCRHELVPAPYIQTEAEILSATPERYAAMNRMMGDILTFLTSQPTR